PAVGAIRAIDTAAESHSRTREPVHGCLRALAPRVCRRHVRRCHDWFGLAVRAAADGRSAQPCMVCGWRWRNCWLFQSLLALLVKSRTLVPFLCMVLTMPAFAAGCAGSYWLAVPGSCKWL